MQFVNDFTEFCVHIVEKIFNSTVIEQNDFTDQDSNNERSCRLGNEWVYILAFRR